MPRKSPGNAKPITCRRPSGISLYRRATPDDHVVHGTGDLARGEQGLVGRQMNVARHPLELRDVGVIERAADAQRPQCAGRAASETRAIGISKIVPYHSRCLSGR